MWFCVDQDVEAVASAKSEEEAALIGAAIRSNFLFQHLTLPQKNTVIQLMQKVTHTYIHTYIVTLKKVYTYILAIKYIYIHIYIVHFPYAFKIVFIVTFIHTLYTLNMVI